MSHSPLLDSTIVFISNNEDKTRALLNIIRRREVSRRVHWLRNKQQVQRHFQDPQSFLDNSLPDQNVSIILDYDLEGVSIVTKFLEDQGVLKVCTLYSLNSVSEEVNEITKTVKVFQ
ncbi:MAG: hypothetical protein CMB80_18460 [Flammeovirgaceae bacterium]|nr:hypothetical protein [Flammeovirgaceae bacterium]|tara:strand:- start:700 stop:1050 length:351 start_codon:yes stop_codon:yes gene_type:complete